MTSAVLTTNFAGVPAWAWLVVATQAALLAAGLARLVRRKHGHRERDWLLRAGLAFCAVILGAYVVGTYEGSVAFARDALGWTNWRKVIPWATLDAAGFGFGLFWIRAKIRKRSPVRPRRVVLISAAFSAFIQMTQGGELHKWRAGAFLAFLAALGWLMLHTVIDQVRQADEDLDESLWTRYPPFGLRWITWPTNTVCAWLAWINHPPIDLTPTVANAITHLERVRSDKRSSRSERAAKRATERAERRRQNEAEQVRRSTIRAAVEAAEHPTPEHPERPVTEHPERVTGAAPVGPRATPRSAVPPASEQRSGAPELTDDEAVKAMLREHPERDYVWAKREVRRLTGAGFGRIDKLIAAVAEHHARSTPEHPAGAEPEQGHEASTNDDQERPA